MAVFAMLASYSIAQSTYGSIVGTVTDKSGAVVPGAAVTVTNVGTTEARTVKSDALGNFTVVNLFPEVYKVEAQMTGYKKFDLAGVEVQVGATVRADVALQLGAVTEIIQVTSRAPLLQSDSSSLSTQIEGPTVQEMPLNGRNVMNLLTLAAGVIPQGSSAGGVANGLATAGVTDPAGWSNYSIGGGLAGANAFYIDGAPSNILNSNQVGLVVTQDALQEFNVVQNETANYGRNGGGVVNMATKAGTNEIHATAYEYIRNTILNTNEFFNKQNEYNAAAAAGTLTTTNWNKPGKFNMNQYGVSVGAPVKKDKIFAHFNWEAFSGLTAALSATYVPTTAMVNGTFTTAITDPLGNCNIAHDAAAGTWTITNLWSGSCGDPLAKIMRTYVPPPTTSKPVSGNNYFVSPPLTNKQVQYNGRVDWNLSMNQRLFTRYTYWKEADGGQNIFGDYNGWPTGESHSEVVSNQAVVGYTYTLSPNTFLDVRLSWLHEYAPTGLPECCANYSKLATTPANYLASESSLFAYPMLPVMNFTGSSSQMWTLGTGGLAIQTFATYSAAANVIHVMGKHSVKAGFEVQQLTASIFGKQNSSGNVAGAFTYDNTYTGNDWASFLMGELHNVGGKATGGQIGLYTKAKGYNYYQAYYLTDTWQTTRNLTLNLGLRYEVPGVIESRDNVNGVFLPSYQWITPAGQSVTGMLAMTGSSIYRPRSPIDNYLNLVSPRVGLAYRIGNDTAVRAGYGISYLGVDAETLNNIMPANSAFDASITTCGSSSSSMPSATGLMYNCFLNTPLVLPATQSTNIKSWVASNYVNQPTQQIGAPITGQKPSYVEQWNLAVSRQFKGDFMVELGYAGLSGTHLFMDGWPAGGIRGLNINQVPDNDYQVGRDAATGYETAFATVGPDTGKEMFATGYCGNGASVGQCLKPFPAYGNLFSEYSHNTSTIYHAAEVKAEKRFKRGGLIMGNYVWSKNIGNTESNSSPEELKYSGTGRGSLTGISVQDFTNLRGERSVLAHDVPQRAVISYVLDLPFGKGQMWGESQTGVVGHAISGWALSGITTFQKGFHMGFIDKGFSGGSGKKNPDTGTATLSGTNLSLQNSFGTGILRPNKVAGCNLMQGVTGSYASRVISGRSQFNQACYTTPEDFTLGNAPRVEPKFFAQGIDNFDLSATKTTNLTERLNLQFRAEFFNIFNRIQFAQPNTSKETGSYGSPTVTVNQPREMQLSLRLNY